MMLFSFFILQPQASVFSFGKMAGADNLISCGAGQIDAHISAALDDTANMLTSGMTRPQWGMRWVRLLSAVSHARNGPLRRARGVGGDRWLFSGVIHPHGRG